MLYTFVYMYILLFTKIYSVAFRNISCFWCIEKVYIKNNFLKRHVIVKLKVPL